MKNYKDPILPAGWYRIKVVSQERKTDRFWSWRRKRWVNSDGLLLEISHEGNFVIRQRKNSK